MRIIINHLLFFTLIAELYKIIILSLKYYNTTIWWTGMRRREKSHSSFLGRPSPERRGNRGAPASKNTENMSTAGSIVCLPHHIEYADYKNNRITIETIMTILLVDCTDRRTDNVLCRGRFSLRYQKEIIGKIRSCFYLQIVIFSLKYDIIMMTH